MTSDYLVVTIGYLVVTIDYLVVTSDSMPVTIDYLVLINEIKANRLQRSKAYLHSVHK